MATAALKILNPRPKFSLRDDPAYAKAEARFRELRSRVAQLLRQRDDLLCGLSDPGVGRDIDRRAAALLAGGEVEEAPEARRDRLRAELGEVTDQLRVAQRAVELQKVNVDRERSRAGAVITQRLMPEHRAIVGRIHTALQALSAALVMEEKFRDELALGDVPFGEIHPMPLAGDSLRLDKSYSLANLWVDEARAFHLID